MQYSNHIHSPHTYEQFTLQLGLSHDANGVVDLVLMYNEIHKLAFLI